MLMPRLSEVLLHHVKSGERMADLERCNEMSDVLVGVDMGTGSSKAVVTNADGQILATATRPRPNSMSMPRPGWAEVNAESVWWGDVVSLCQELVAQLAGRDSGALRHAADDPGGRAEGAVGTPQRT